MLRMSKDPIPNRRSQLPFGTLPSPHWASDLEQVKAVEVHAQLRCGSIEPRREVRRSPECPPTPSARP